ncbi:phosphotransferase [Ruegeria faecimaris]|uniref:Phosphotransferase enzyme family protein n=1 Tax=Ruegeria faecimaris TaxID=686389 RepID=A0A521D862_9RHOB|nr:phosphotransferase [Ruegeria faecimaris]SMO67271.1 Phosphotransferase enzyme family protein [Ruegeria faecimaris]
MLTLTTDEYERARGFVQEFLDQTPEDGPAGFECVYRSHDFAGSRIVLRVRGARRDYALKVDTESPGTGRLRDEFDMLGKLTAHFARYESAGVVDPVYISPGDAFFVTQFIDRPTAADLIHNSPDDDQIGRIYRRAGSWLNDLHSFQPIKTYSFRPSWMVDKLQALLGLVPDTVQPWGQKMVQHLTHEAAQLKGITDLLIHAHGDFHSQNLIVGQGEMIGLDLTEAREKLAVYDIVDFLKSDIFRDGTEDQIDQSGILKTNKDMFFRKYRHPIQMDVLDMCMRARLVMDWLDLWRLDRSCSEYESFRRDRLNLRLQAVYE